MWVSFLKASKHSTKHDFMFWALEVGKESAIVFEGFFLHITLVVDSHSVYLLPQLLKVLLFLNPDDKDLGCMLVMYVRS